MTNRIAAVFAVGHVIAWQIHVIEVNLNKPPLSGIFVAEYELREYPKPPAIYARIFTVANTICKKSRRIDR